MNTSNLIAKNLADIRDRLRQCERQYDRPINSVALLAVSKGQSLQKISDAIAAGQIAFGENYLQEALLKIASFSNPQLEWHFLGTIQSNKAKKIAEVFSWVHSVSSIRTAELLNKYRLTASSPLNVCIEVNTSHENSKTGALFADTFELAEYCMSCKQLNLRGLMTIPAPKKSFSEQRDEFKILRTLFEKMREKGFMLDTLSMGMSADWEAAVAEGSTLIRIGTAIFGERN